MLLELKEAPVEMVDSALDIEFPKLGSPILDALGLSTPAAAII